MAHRVRVVAGTAALCIAFCFTSSAVADDNFPLDAETREIAPTQAVRCDREALLSYRGTHLRYDRTLLVHPAFAARLVRFEAVVRDTAIEIYGRAPRRIAHLGSFVCRRINAYPNLKSEHALGNALDVAGFDFGPAKREDVIDPALPRALRRPFRVRVLEHWDANAGAGAVHGRFLRTLAARLIARNDIFRVLLGPAWPGHHNHFHFDCAPYRLVAIFPPTRS